MAIILDTTSQTLRCDDCGRFEHQKPGVRIKHSSRCDADKCQPTPEQCGVVTPVAPSTSALSPREQAIYEAKVQAQGKCVTADEAAELRRTGHSWQDVFSGNHDC